MNTDILIVSILSLLYKLLPPKNNGDSRNAHRSHGEYLDEMLEAKPSSQEEWQASRPTFVMAKLCNYSKNTFSHKLTLRKKWLQNGGEALVVASPLLRNDLFFHQNFNHLVR